MRATFEPNCGLLPAALPGEVHPDPAQPGSCGCRAQGTAGGRAGACACTLTSGTAPHRPRRRSPRRKGHGRSGTEGRTTEPAIRSQGRRGQPPLLVSQAVLFERIGWAPKRPAASVTAAFPDIQFDLGAFINPAQVFNDGAGNVTAQFPPVYTLFLPVKLTRTPTRADQATLATRAGHDRGQLPGQPGRRADLLGVLRPAVLQSAAPGAGGQAHAGAARRPEPPGARRGGPVPDRRGGRPGRRPGRDRPRDHQGPVQRQRGHRVQRPAVPPAQRLADQADLGVAVAAGQQRPERPARALARLRRAAQLPAAARPVRPAGPAAQAGRPARLRVRVPDQPGLDDGDGLRGPADQRGRPGRDHHVRGQRVGQADQRAARRLLRQRLDRALLARDRGPVPVLRAAPPGPRHPDGEPFTERCQYMFRSNQLGTPTGSPRWATPTSSATAAARRSSTTCSRAPTPRCSGPRTATASSPRATPGSAPRSPASPGSATRRRCSRCPGRPTARRCTSGRTAPGSTAWTCPRSAPSPDRPGSRCTAGSNQFKLQFLIYVPTADLFARMRTAQAAQQFQKQFLAGDDRRQRPGAVHHRDPAAELPGPAPAAPGLPAAGTGRRALRAARPARQPVRVGHGQRSGSAGTNGSGGSGASNGSGSAGSGGPAGPVGPAATATAAPATATAAAVAAPAAATAASRAAAPAGRSAGRPGSG